MKNIENNGFYWRKKLKYLYLRHSDVRKGNTYCKRQRTFVSKWLHSNCQLNRSCGRNLNEL